MEIDNNGVPIHVKLAFNTIENGFKLITGKDDDGKLVKEVRGEIGRSQLNILRMYWNNELISKLQPYSHIKLESMKLVKEGSM